MSAPTLNTQAILLLTAPLIMGRRDRSAELLSFNEYNRLARALREMNVEPADLLGPKATEILEKCRSIVDVSRANELLSRAFLASQVVEKWSSRAIWVVSRADSEYPRRLKARLKEDAPPILYGCGDTQLLEGGGLAVVGSRNVDVQMLDFAHNVGALTAESQRTLISGGARGIDVTAMRGASRAGGSVIGVLADDLERAALASEHREGLLDKKVVFISPFDPCAGFNVGNAMQRNKIVYSLADAALVVSSDFEKGGTWAGAVEQLDQHKFIPVFVRTGPDTGKGIEALQKKGALSWPNPRDVASFRAALAVRVPSTGQPKLKEAQDSDSVAAVSANSPDGPFNETNRTHLFISYAIEDSLLANWLARKLAASGFPVWFDKMRLLGTAQFRLNRC